MIKGPEGAYFQHTKGEWKLDKMPVEVGPDGVKAVLIFNEAKVGSIRFVDGRPETDIWLYRDNPVNFLEVREGWDPCTEIPCVFVDEVHKGTIATFSSASWGGWYLFRGLIKPFVRAGMRYPVCTFDSKLRPGDKNGNFDPVAVICGWADPADFPGFATPSAPQISHRPSARALDILDDDVGGDSSEPEPPPDPDDWDIR
jgi:hypothetical protein